MPKENQFNFNATNQQNQIGDNNTQTQNNATEEVVTIEQMFDDFKQQVQDVPFPDDTPEEIKGDYETPEIMLGAAYDQAVAEVDASAASTQDETAKINEKQLWTKRFKWLGTLGVKIGTAFAKELIKQSPLSPVLAACQVGLEVVESAADTETA